MSRRDELRSIIVSLGNPQKARSLSNFFKTGVGEYGEGDAFLGVSTPQIQRAIQPFVWLCTFNDLKELLTDPYHEVRMAAIRVLVEKYRQSHTKDARNEVVQFYIAHLDYCNNWDFIDVSAYQILGEHLVCTKQSPIETLSVLAKSTSLWRKRAAIVSTFAYIRKRDYEYTFYIGDLLLHEKHDLLHKAVGWMLREVWKHCGKEILLQYLCSRYSKIPRTSLRYAIERFEPSIRKEILQGNFNFT